MIRKSNLAFKFLSVFLLVSCAAFAAGTAQQMDFLMAGMRDPSTDDPLDSGLVYTYSAGTLIAKSTWTTAAKAATEPNPIVLDSYGRALAFADGKYKIIVKTSSGTTLYTWDNVEYRSVSTLASTTTNPFGPNLTQTSLTVASLTATLTANLGANGYKIISLATGTANGDAVNLGQTSAINATVSLSLASLSLQIASLALSITTLTKHAVYISGPATFTVPASVTFIYVSAIAGGGGGGGSGNSYACCGAAGHPGQYVVATAMAVIPSQTISITIGAGGALGASGGGGASGTSGSLGGDTTIGSLTLTGGPGGYHGGSASHAYDLGPVVSIPLSTPFAIPTALIRMDAFKDYRGGCGGNGGGETTRADGSTFSTSASNGMPGIVKIEW